MIAGGRQIAVAGNYAKEGMGNAIVFMFWSVTIKVEPILAEK